MLIVAKWSAIISTDWLAERLLSTCDGRVKVFEVESPGRTPSLRSAEYVHRILPFLTLSPGGHTHTTSLAVWTVESILCPLVSGCSWFISFNVVWFIPINSKSNVGITQLNSSQSDFTYQLRKATGPLTTGYNSVKTRQISTSVFHWFDSWNYRQ